MVEASFIAALLFTYSLGTAAPLFFLAWLWDRHQLGRRAWLRGRALRFGPLELHSTNLLAGTLFILLGLSFIGFQGSSGLSGLYSDLGLDELGFRAQLWVADAAGRVPEALWGLGALLVVGGGWLWRRQRAARRPAESWARTERSGS
jgi:cytochrome c biogenesis protein CcdA